MSGPPPPPRKKNIKSQSKLETDELNSSIDSNHPLGSPAVSGAAYNVARLRTPPVIAANNFYSIDSNINDDLSRQMHKEEVKKPEPKIIILPVDLLKEIPETIVGQHVVIRGELEYERLLRIDGLFTGTLISKGDLIIGVTGKVVGNVYDFGSVLLDGTVVGNIHVDILTLRGRAVVHGDITCRSLTVEPTVVICGRLNVHPAAPETIDVNGLVVQQQQHTAASPEEQIELAPIKEKNTKITNAGPSTAPSKAVTAGGVSLDNSAAASSHAPQPKPKHEEKKKDAAAVPAAKVLRDETVSVKTNREVKELKSADVTKHTSDNFVEENSLVSENNDGDQEQEEDE